MAQLEPFGSRRGMLAGSLSMVVEGSGMELEVDMAAGGLDVDPEAEAEVCAVLAFWAGPITCSNLVL